MLVFGVAVSSAANSQNQVGGPQAKVTNPHGPISIPCQSCHTYTSWKPIRSNPEFNHDSTGYPLRGMHAKVGCTECHSSLVFKNVSTTCADCHADIHRRQFGANCESCHTVSGWHVSVQAIRNHQNRFPLVGAHAVVPCEECHKNAAASQFVGLSTDCYTCHQADYRTPVIDHVGLNFPTTCGSCHSVNSWYGARFDHLKVTGYALTGAHATLECTACHANNRYAGTPADCYSCHTTDFQSSNNPPHVQLGMPRDCSTCHTTSNWSNAKFDHTLYAHWPLVGMHATVACAQCHTNSNYTSVPTDCYSCHKADFTGTTNPNHVSGGFPTDCSTCHTAAGWSPSTFNHSTVFALTGAHVTLTCAQCHTNGNYSASLPTSCYGCHQADYNGTNNPAHASSGFPTTCETCHNTSSWLNASFDHNKTAFPLTGAHINVPCTSCHVNNVFVGTPTDCYSCHKADYNGTTDPNHVASAFPTTCATCHTTTSWSGATFNHNNTPFPLTGAHANVPCASCHINNNYTSLPTDCYSCHKADFTGTTNPNHVSGGFPTTCTTCHTTTAWIPSTFNHSSVFPLVGAHANLACTQCHTNNNYTTVPKDCYSCHAADFNSTNNPSHLQLTFPHTCDTCHNTTNWLNATFNHTLYANYPLTGMHATLTCDQCHTNNNYVNTPTACYGCHQADFTGTTNPNHVASGFPTDCSICHTTTGWSPSSFNHNNTAFPLTGAHVNLACTQCHVNGNYTTLPTTCYGCHQADFTGTTNPSHAAAGFPTTCDTCHTTTSWAGATFNHNNTPFPLTGAHVNVACTLCHINNVFAGTPTDCYSCHTADYNGTTNPNHSTAGWPTTCTTCHTTAAWLPATLPASYHTFFPLNHGNANGICANCHTNSSDYSIFTCTSCHGGNNAANFSHPKVSGYVYNSTNCYACHRNGQGG